MKKEDRKRRVVKAIRLVFDSLDSHLDLAIENPRKHCESCGSRQFHSKAIKEYAEIIDILTDHI